MSDFAHTRRDIDLGACSGCGSCAELCPVHLFSVDEEGGKKRARTVPAFADACMRCGHCVAACRDPPGLAGGSLGVSAAATRKGRARTRRADPGS